MSRLSANKHPPLEEIFQTIRGYHELNLSKVLRQILSDKNLDIPALYTRLSDRGYYLSLESLYRYFNPSPSSNRFPSQDFLEAFSAVLQLTEEESETLLLFWRYWKLVKKCQCSRSYTK